MNNLRIRLYVLRKGLHLKSYSLRMGLEPKTSYSWKGSGFLGIYIYIKNHLLQRDLILHGNKKHIQDTRKPSLPIKIRNEIIDLVCSSIIFHVSTNLLFCILCFPASSEWPWPNGFQVLRALPGDDSK